MPSAADLAAIKAFNDESKARQWPFTCFPAGDFEHQALNAAFTTWQEKAAGRPMPGRADITARAAKPFIQNMSLLERTENGRYRLRLHGTALTRYEGDKTGLHLDQIVEGGRVDGYAALYDLVLDRLVPLKVESRYQGPDISYLTGESFAAPLSRTDGAPLVLSVTFAKPRRELVDR
jgi:hypothetical protein